jgi:hypothetical protein
MPISVVFLDKIFARKDLIDGDKCPGKILNKEVIEIDKGKAITLTI